MSILTWNDNFSVNIEQMDKQHRKLIDIINRLSEVAQYNQNNEAIGKILQALEEYIEFHFTDEENLMRKYHYHKLDAHRRAHQNLIFELFRYRNLYDSHKLVFNELANFIANWLVDHIMVEDKEYKSMINSTLKVG